MYYFSIPDSSKTRIGNMAMLHLMREHPEWFYDDFKINVAYGCSPSCIWNGGRVEKWNKYSNDLMDSVVKFFRDCDIKYRLNYTNPCLEEQHLADEYGNRIAKVVNDIGGEVAITLPLMAKHIKNKYQNLDIVWSTSTDYGETVTDKIRKINQLSEYDLVVLPYTFNNKQELNDFVHPENLEILVCDGCIDNCEFRNQHHLRIGQSIVCGEFDENLNQCQRETDIYQRDFSKFQSIVPRNKLREYINKGISRFKISGRESIEKAISSYLYYFVKSEYEDVFFDNIGSDIENILVSLGITNRNIYHSSYFDKQLCKRLFELLKCRVQEVR